MTADIINLRRAGKHKARAEASLAADRNRAKFSRPKAERAATTSETTRLDRHLDHHQREPDTTKHD